MFYKLVDEYTVEKFKNPLRIEGKHIFTNSEKILNENGYYRVVIDEQPEIILEENQYWNNKYEVIDNKIHKIWEIETFEEIFIEEEELNGQDRI